jgi:hypothetical protein
MTNIIYSILTFGQEFTPIVWFVNPLPINKFVPTLVAGNLPVMDEFKTQVESILASGMVLNKAKTVDVAWCSMLVSGHSVYQATLVYRVANTFAIWNGQSFMYIWPPQRLKILPEWVEEVTYRQFPPPINSSEQ